MEEFYVGMQDYMKLIERNCNERGCKEVLAYSCKRYLHKKWQSYLHRLEEADPDLSTLKQLCNIPGSVFMTAKMWKMDYIFTPHRIHVINAHEAKPTETEVPSTGVEASTPKASSQINSL